ncbi:MAG: adventurous gliding motility protein CglE [Myxococcaceae bacterium]
MRKLILLVAVLVAPSLASAATPSEGVALEVRRGFFTETDIGGFMTLGGDNAYSNLQTYLQLGVGYDVSQSIELGVHFGMGSNAANCFNGLKASGECSATDNFTVTFIDFTAAYLFKLADRFYLDPKLAVGYTMLDPAPVVTGTGADQVSINSGMNVGAGVGIEYATSMDHFSIGLDVLGRYILGPNILTLQFFPRVKYTF